MLLFCRKGLTKKKLPLVDPTAFTSRWDFTKKKSKKMLKSNKIKYCVGKGIPKETPWAIYSFPLSDDLDENIKYLTEFLAGLDKNYTYILSMCVGMLQEGLSRPFSQLGPHILVNKEENPEYLGSILELRVEEKLLKQYSISIHDIVYFKYRIQGQYVHSKHEKIKIDAKIRVPLGKIKAQFLSTKYAPFSCKDEDYGVGVLIRENKFKEVAQDGDMGAITIEEYDGFLYKEKYIIIRKKIDNNKIESIVCVSKYKFNRSPYLKEDLHTLLNYTDEIKEDCFIRKYNNLKLVFKHSGELLYYEANHNRIRYIEPKEKETKQIKNIITLDIETFQDKDQLLPCALGFFDGNKSYVYVLEGEDYNGLIKRCFEELLTPKYDNFTVYVHNLANFDAIFLLKSLENSGFYVKALFKKGKKILEMKVGSNTPKRITNEKNKVERQDKKQKKKICRVLIKDSMDMLPHSLRDLGSYFIGCKNKSYFPYKYLKKETLNYVGEEVPHISYWENVPKEYYANLKKKT